MALGKDAAPIDADVRVEGVAEDDRFRDGAVFDQARIADYVAGFPIKTHRLSVSPT
jgi:hypothetical protein